MGGVRSEELGVRNVKLRVGASHGLKFIFNNVGRGLAPAVKSQQING